MFIYLLCINIRLTTGVDTAVCEYPEALDKVMQLHYHLDMAPL